MNRTPLSIRPPRFRLNAAMTLTLAALPPLLGGCTGHDFKAPEPMPEAQSDQRFEVSQNRDVDLLFMIDNSPSTQEKQDNFNQNFPKFMETLRAIDGGLPNLHIAVVTSDLGAAGVTIPGSCEGIGDAGKFQNRDLNTGNPCGIQNDGHFIIATKDGSNLETGKTLENVFSCMANRGIHGCGQEHQLQSVRLALLPQAGINLAENTGFLRAGAYLAIVLLTDEDDCSAPPDSAAAKALFSAPYMGTGKSTSLRCAVKGHLCNGKEPEERDGFTAPLAQCTSNPDPNGPLIPVASIIRDIKALKAPNYDKILVSAIAGVPDPGNVNYRYGLNDPDKVLDYLPICNGQYTGANGAKHSTVATYPIRINEFVRAFNDTAGDGLFSVCQENYSDALKAIAKAIGNRLKPGCLSSRLIIEKDPKTGIKGPDCEVSDLLPSGAKFKDVSLPQCTTGGKRPCWELSKEVPSNMMQCNPAYPYKITVDRAGQEAPTGTQQSIKCRICTLPNDPRCADLPI